jgi:hypothetical protein
MSVSKSGNIRKAVRLLAKHWPGQGARHRAYAALAGGLLRDGLSVAEVEEIISSLADRTKDEEADKRLARATETAARLAANERAAGWPSLGKILGADGPAVVTEFRERLGLLVSVDSLAALKLLPPDFLRNLGLRDLEEGGVEIPYRDARGKEVALKVRRGRSASTYRWAKGSKVFSYGDDRLETGVRADYLTLVEGESDCWTLWFHGEPALGLPGSDTVAKTLHRGHVEPFQLLYVVRESDDAGEQFVENVARRLAELNWRGELRVVRLGTAKDPSNLHCQDPDRFAQRWQEAIKAAEPLAVTKAEGGGLATTCLTGMQPEPVDWLVPDLLPLGKLTLFAGDGGHGKSLLTLGLSTAVTTGRPAFGLDYSPPPPGDVLLVSCEDDFADTVLPRLIAMGADLARCRRVDGSIGPDGKVAPFSLLHFNNVEAELTRRPEVRLIVIDPAGAYIGNTGIDDHKDSQLRALLGPLAEVAARRAVCVVLVKHLNRNTAVKAVNRVMGSAGYVNTVRAAFLVAPDPDDEDRRLFLPMKSNLSPSRAGFAFRPQALPEGEALQALARFPKIKVEDRDRLIKQLFRLEFLGPVDTDPDEALTEAARKDRGPTRVEKCAEWLESYLQGGAKSSRDIEAAARGAGFTVDNLIRAKRELRAKGLQHSNRGQLGGGWWSGFGEPETWILKFPENHGTHETHDNPENHENELPSEEPSPPTRATRGSRATREGGAETHEKDPSSQEPVHCREVNTPSHDNHDNPENHENRGTGQHNVPPTRGTCGTRGCRGAGDETHDNGQPPQDEGHCQQANGPPHETPDNHDNHEVDLPRQEDASENNNDASGEATTPPAAGRTREVEL